jgi:hypothetical protein
MNRAPSLSVLTLLCLVPVAAACGSDDPSPTQPDPGDATAPSVTLTASEEAVTEDGSVVLTANATDNVGVVSVTFQDGATTIGTDSSPPWSLDLDMTAANNGQHSYTATARDAAGNATTSAAATLDVAIPNLPTLEDFDDNARDSTVWSIAAGGGATAAETGQRLELTIPAAPTEADPSAGFRLRCSLMGDLDVQVDYEVVTWPAQSGVRTALGSTFAAAERVSFAAGDFTGMESYASHHSAVTTESTTDTSGTLRLTRVGSTYTSYYWNGTGWNEMQSTAVDPTVEVGLHLTAWTHSSFFIKEEVTIAFDNFTVNEGAPGSCS